MAQKVAIAGEEKTKIVQAKELVESHETAKRQTDKMILGIKDAKVRAKYLVKRQDARGRFSEMLDKVTVKFMELASEVEGLADRLNPFSSPTSNVKGKSVPRSQFGSDDSMGFLMLAPFAIKGALVIAAAAVLYAAGTYAAAIKKEKDMQAEILSDKSLSTSDKAKLLAVVTGDVLQAKAGAILLPLIFVGGAFFLLRSMAGAKANAVGSGLDAVSRLAQQTGGK